MKHKATGLDIYRRSFGDGFMAWMPTGGGSVRKGKESLSLARFLRRAADYIERKEGKK